MEKKSKQPIRQRSPKKKDAESLNSQMEERAQRPKVKTEAPAFEGSDTVVSTGSTLLDLAISGGRFPEGGIPCGILVEIFGPASAGKTVLLCQIAGNVQKAGGENMFHDPEARLNAQFARMFGLDTSTIMYTVPNTVTQVFQGVRAWGSEASKKGAIKGIFADSLAALSTDMEMESEDKMGMRRAKEFSEQLRKTCRLITEKNLLVVCSNQVRQNSDAGPFGQKYKSPGGEAIGFYSSLRLRCQTPQKIKVKRSISGVAHERVIGVQTEIEVFKSSVWKPYRKATVPILFDYGIDDIRANLEFIKKCTKSTTYVLNDKSLDKSLSQSIQLIEELGGEQELKEATIKLWHEIEGAFNEERKSRF